MEPSGELLRRLVDATVAATLVGRVQWERWAGVPLYVAQIGSGWAELRRSPEGPVDTTSGWRLSILNSERQVVGEVDTSLCGAIEGAARIAWDSKDAAYFAEQLDRLGALVVPNRSRAEELAALQSLERLIDDLARRSEP